MSDQESLSRWIKQEALQMGFFHCGISRAEFLEEEAPRLEKWLHQNYHGDMGWMANHFDKRLDPRLLVPGAKSVISLLFNYYTEAVQPENAPKISRYAYGKDYHLVIKDKLHLLFSRIREKAGHIEGRVFVDSAPVMDKAWAKRSGLGWVGKHTNLINKEAGSYFFIAEIICDLELAYDGPVKDYCGTCTRCIDACPTDAITEPYQVDGSKCISYFTIELKKEIPQEMHGKFGDWAFGCDICQEVCPWNRFASEHDAPELKPYPEILEWDEKDWHEMTEEAFRQIFRHSPIKRTGFDGLKRNLKFITHEPPLS